MVYVKSILVGLVAAILSLVLLATAGIFVARRSFPGQAQDVSVSGSSALIVGLVMFAVGYVWMFRRSSRKPRPG